MSRDPRTVQLCGLCGAFKEKRIGLTGWRRRPGSAMGDRMLRVCPVCDLTPANPQEPPQPA